MKEKMNVQNTLLALQLKSHIIVSGLITTNLMEVPSGKKLDIFWPQKVTEKFNFI